MRRKRASRGGVRVGRSEFRLRHNRTDRQNCFFAGPVTATRRFRDERLTPEQFWMRFFPACPQCACAGPSRPTEGESRPPGRKWWRRRKGRRRARRSRALAEGLEGRGGGKAPRKWRRDVQSAASPASTAANRPPPRAPRLASRAFLHHVRVRWAVAGYKGLRPSGRPPFLGSFRG